MDLVKRARATQATVDKFKGRDFEVGTGKYDCVQMMIFQAKGIGRRIKVAKYTDFITGRNALDAYGVSTIGEAMDKLFPRIDPAKAILGDFLEAPGTDHFSGLMVSVGNGKVLGFHESIPHADILQPVLISGAWSLE